jgi:hypothetical protein
MRSLVFDALRLRLHPEESQIRTLSSTKTSVAALIAVTVAAGAAQAASTGPATPPQTARGTAPTALPHACKKVTVAGHKWSIVVSEFRCATAIDIVRRLATKKVPARRAPYRGTYSGVRCVGGPTAGRLPTSIICGMKRAKPFPAVSAFKAI